MLYSMLEGLSEESLVLWRLILREPVRMHLQEVRRSDVQGLVYAGLIEIKSDLYPTRVADLKPEYRQYRLDDLQKALLKVIRTKTFSKSDLYLWAEENHISAPLTYIKNLTDLKLVKADNSTGEIIFKLL